MLHSDLSWLNVYYTLLLCVCRKYVDKFFCIATVGNPSLMPLMVSSITSWPGSVLVQMLYNRSKQYLVYHICQWLLYLAKFWQFWVEQALGTSIKCKNHAPIALQHRLSVVGNKCTRTVQRMNALCHGHSSCRAPLFNTFVMGSFACCHPVALSLGCVAILFVLHEHM